VIICSCWCRQLQVWRRQSRRHQHRRLHALGLEKRENDLTNLLTLWLAALHSMDCMFAFCQSFSDMILWQYLHHTEKRQSYILQTNKCLLCKETL